LIGDGADGELLSLTHVAELDGNVLEAESHR
jgi:hypothetical protein